MRFNRSRETRIRIPSSLIATLIGIAALCALAAIDGAAPEPARAAPGASDYVPGALIVTFDAGTSAARTSVASVDGASVRRVAAGGRFASVSVPVGEEDEYLSRLSALPGVSSAERDTLKQPSFIPNDEMYDLQWDMPLIQIEGAWNVTMGDGVTVAVLDTGVAFEYVQLYGNQHVPAPDLEDTAFVSPYDAINGGDDPVDEDGHGTHVTGTIAQNTDNEFGVAGVAPHATIMPVRVCSYIGCPGFAIADGLQWAVDHGADVINLSLGGYSISKAERDALQYAEDNGVLVVAASGNGGADKKGDGYLDYPAAVDSVFSVGAIRYDKQKAPYSNYGVGDSVGLDVVAPGGDLTVDQNNDGFADGVLQNTFAFRCGGGPFGDYTSFDFCYYQGTSMATPHVAGTAALLLSVYPDLTPEQVRQIIRCSALDLGEPGYDDVFGAGLLQAASALADSDEDGTADCLDETPEPAPPIVAIESASVDSGDEVTVSLSAEVDEPGLAAYAITVSFDPNVVDVTGCNSELIAICNVNYADDALRFSGAAIPALVGHIDLAEITFHAIADQHTSTALDIELDDFVDDDLVDLVPVTVVHDGEIVVEFVLKQKSGDVDCDDDVDTLDILAILRYSAAIEIPDCIAVGDVDCDVDVDAVDALKVAKFLAGLPYTVSPGCPPIGEVG